MNSNYYKIGPFNISCMLLHTGLFSDFWRWKLDPYLVFDQENCHATIRRIEGKTNHFLNQKERVLLDSEVSGFFDRRVYRQSDGTYDFELVERANEYVMLHFQVNQEWNEILLMEDHTESGGMAAFEYLSQITPGLFLKQRALTFHSCLIEYNDYAFAICADSGVGKTTRARLWRDEKNALILNGDRTVCQHGNEGWIAYGTPWSGTSGEQINRSAPLRALVILERADDCEQEVFRLSPMDALPRLMAHLLYPKWDGALTEIALTEFDRLLMELPVLHLRCRPDLEGVEMLERALEDIEN